MRTNIEKSKNYNGEKENFTNKPEKIPKTMENLPKLLKISREKYEKQKEKEEELINPFNEYKRKMAGKYQDRNNESRLVKNNIDYINAIKQLSKDGTDISLPLKYMQDCIDSYGIDRRFNQDKEKSEIDYLLNTYYDPTTKDIKKPNSENTEQTNSKETRKKKTGDLMNYFKNYFKTIERNQPAHLKEMLENCKKEKSKKSLKKEDISKVKVNTQSISETDWINDNLATKNDEIIEKRKAGKKKISSSANKKAKNKLNRKKQTNLPSDAENVVKKMLNERTEMVGDIQLDRVNKNKQFTVNHEIFPPHITLPDGKTGDLSNSQNDMPKSVDYEKAEIHSCSDVTKEVDD